jgi:hypothetical protein
MYIKNRYNRDGDVIQNPKTYKPKHTVELTEFLNEVYSKDNENFDQNNN